MVSPKKAGRRTHEAGFAKSKSSDVVRERVPKFVAKGMGSGVVHERAAGFVKGIRSDVVHERVPKFVKSKSSGPARKTAVVTKRGGPTPSQLAAMDEIVSLSGYTFTDEELDELRAELQGAEPQPWLSSAESVLRAVAAEVGLSKAIELLASERSKLELVDES